MEDDISKADPNCLPLSVQMEGKSRTMTIIMEATIALWMISLAADGRGFFIQRITFDGNGLEGLHNYLLYMIIGALAAAIAVGALSLNFRPLELDTWRKRSCRSVFALVIINLMAIDQSQLVFEVIFGDNRGGTIDEYESSPATAFLTLIGLIWTISVNVLFIKHFGWCICCRSEKTGRDFVHGAQARLNDLPVAQMVRSGEQENRTTVDLEALNHQEDSQMSTSRVQEVVGAQHSVNNETQACNRLRLDRWPTRQLIEFTAVHTIPQSTQREIIEENETTNESPETRSTTVEAKVPNSAYGLGRSVLNDVSLFNKPISKNTILELWSILKEEPGKFQYPVWVKSAFITSAVVLIYYSIRSISIIFSLVDKYKLNRDRIANNMDGLDDFLAESDYENGLDDINNSIYVRLLLLADKVILDFKWTALAGYPIGTMFSFGGLVAVLAQYKRMSLTVFNGLNKLDTESVQKHIHLNAQWMELFRRYPISGACFFLAILSSTAVLQTQIIGFVLSTLLGLLVNLTELKILWNLFGMYLVAFAVIFTINSVVLFRVQSSLVSEDGTKIKHPRWFHFCIVILAMVHLVIGLLYALWRVCYLLVITVLILSRLDVSLFTSGKSMDNGHSAFMSMLMTGVVIQQGTKHCTEVQSMENPPKTENSISHESSYCD